MVDTIAAISTGGGISAIGIIRVSGAGAIPAADRVFRAFNGVRMGEAGDRKLIYGELIGVDGGVIDICLCTVSRGPGSYTGEDTAEFQCHGSPVVLSEGLRALFSAGVRQAEAGEFTKRAFLNGRMDLSQAEAVIDLIEAETAEAAKNAAGQIMGAIGRKADAIYNRLLDISVHFNAVIDYPDEDIADFEMRDYRETLHDAARELEGLLATFDRGRIMKEGIASAIIGRPNAGKSSLLNAILGYDRAIVTSVAGTTRDTIEEKVRFGSVLLRISDTAGMRDTNDAVEKLGVERAHRAARESRLVIAVFDGSEELNEWDMAVISAAETAREKIAVVNKCDLEQKVDVSAIEGRIGPVCRVSALTGEGIEALSASVGKLFCGDNPPPAGEMLTNARQADAAERALSAVKRAGEAFETGVTPDAVLTDIEAALSALGEITGKTMREDVVSGIFSRFCVGK